MAGIENVLIAMSIPSESGRWTRVSGVEWSGVEQEESDSVGGAAGGFDSTLEPDLSAAAVCLHAVSEDALFRSLFRAVED